MSEHYWQVSSSIYGGTPLAPATREEYERVARALEDAATALRGSASLWQTTALQIQNHRYGVPLCTASSADPTGMTHTHATLNVAALGEQCVAHARACDQLAKTMQTMAELLIRAHALYANSESLVQRLFTESIQLFAARHPGAALLSIGVMAASGLTAGALTEGGFNLSLASTATASIQEGALGALGGLLSGRSVTDGLTSTDEVNTAAERIASVSADAKNAVQGNVLTVREVTSATEVVRSSSSVGESMENLRRLAEERLGKISLNSGLDYATIAVQRYEADDGSSSWLVTIPGTDGQSDSPFAWEQNVELMSSNRERRMQADSARMVAEAMHQAGIGADEPVALIGHSQGGIVAATIASDWADEFRIEHVVTAGSPVANHPIPKRTWVTSVEIDDELVAALDGAANPATSNWLTVRGHVTPTTTDGKATIDDQGFCSPAEPVTDNDQAWRASAVPGSTDRKEISHWIKYHQAAYQNATDLGSAAVQQHEAHFQHVIAGTLKETHYYEGRMSQ